MAVYGVSGSATYSETLTGIEQMLEVLPDNLANQITARNVRDVVYTLYEDIQTVSTSVSGSGSASGTYYINPNITGQDFGGIPGGSSFDPAVDLQTLLDQLLYKYVAPTITLSSSTTLLEYGNTSSIVLNWSATRKSLPSTTAIISGPGSSYFIPTTIPANQSNVNSFISSLSYGLSYSSSRTIKPALNVSNTFTFSVNDGTSTTVATAGVSFINRRYWGTLPSSSTLTSTSSNSNFVYSDINVLSSELNTSYVMTKTINCNGEYPVLVWPTNVVDLSTNPPVVMINGMADNSWVKTRSNVVYTNQYGYTASYDVWRYSYLKYSSAKYELS